MKKLLLLLLFSNLFYAQKTTSVYVPMKTYHWDRTETTLEEMDATEGGNFGAVFIFRNYQSEKVFTGKQIGLIRNSFGDPSFILQQEVGYSFKNFNLSLSAGLASGYEKMRYSSSYSVIVNGEIRTIYVEKDTPYNNFPGILKNNGIIPTIMLSLSYTKYRLQPTINISPTFINGGLQIKLD